MLIDSHCHLNYLDNPQTALATARAAGVGGFLCIGVEQTAINEVLAFARDNHDVWASVGQHPTAEHWCAPPDWVEPLLAHDRVLAVGETGLDYHYVDDPQLRRRQRDAFDWQLDLASRHKRPVIVHTRAAEDDTLAALRAHPCVGVLHCFTESWRMAEQALELGYYISISGIVTFNSAEQVREVARRVPADRLLVETDAPWLAPVPQRGKQNEPAFVTHTAKYVAELRGCSAAQLCDQTTTNFSRLFGVTPLR